MLTKHFTALCTFLWLVLFGLLAALCLAPPFQGWGSALAKSSKLVVVAFLLYYLLLDTVYTWLVQRLERHAWENCQPAPWYSFLAVCMSKTGWGLALIFFLLWYANSKIANMARSEFVRMAYANVTPLPDAAVLNLEIIQWLISGEIVLFSLLSAVYLAHTIAQSHTATPEDGGVSPS